MLNILIICMSRCITLFGETDNLEVIKPLETSYSVRCDSLPVPKWEEGYATITGKTLNYDRAKDDNPNAKISPRCSFGGYIDKKHGTAPVDSSGNYNLTVKLYQTHQPCYINVPGYHGLMYLSPGDSVNLAVDFAARRVNGDQGNNGSVTFMGGTDFDLNNMLATNEGQNVIRNSFKGFNKDNSGNIAFINAVMAHRSAQYAQVDTLPFTNRMKQLLNLNIDCDAITSLLKAPIYQLVKPDSTYYSFIPALGVDNHMLRWAEDYNMAISYCSELILSDDSGPELAQMSSDILEDLIATGKLDASEKDLVEGLLKYNIDRMPSDVLKDSKQRFSDRVKWLCDSLQISVADKLQAMFADDSIRDPRKVLNGYLKFISDIQKNYSIPMQSYYRELINNDFSRQSSAFFTTNKDALNTLLKKYDSDFELINKRHDMAKNITRFTDITGIDDDELRQNMIISTYSKMLSEGSLVPDAVFEDISDFSPAAVSFLTEQNEALRQVLAIAVSNICQMSPDNEGDKIILDIVDKHKGKMIFIDIWNTWCGGCLASITCHEQEKGDYADKVAFVYLADETSPETLWNKRIKNITGDHYRLPLDQHNSLMERFNFNGFPSYIIIGSNGDILHTTDYIHSLSELDKWLK